MRRNSGDVRDPAVPESRPVSPGVRAVALAVPRPARTLHSDCAQAIKASNDVPGRQHDHILVDRRATGTRAFTRRCRRTEAVALPVAAPPVTKPIASP